MSGVPQPKIITAPEWGARPAKGPAQPAGRPRRIILHGTAGHGPKGQAPRAQAIAYARSIQRFHMGERGWNDSGHHFLIMRSGLILTGRRGSVTAARAGYCIYGAHCPGQNDQWGIELEHAGDEEPTAKQLTAFVKLAAWLCSRCAMRPTELRAHNDYYATACPTASLERLIPTLRARIAGELNRRGRNPA